MDGGGHWSFGLMRSIAPKTEMSYDSSQSKEERKHNQNSKSNAVGGHVCLLYTRSYCCSPLEEYGVGVGSFFSIQHMGKQSV